MGSIKKQRNPASPSVNESECVFMHLWLADVILAIKVICDSSTLSFSWEWGILQTRGIEKGVNNQPVMVSPSIVIREIWGRISYFKHKFRSRCVAPLQFTSHGNEALGHYERSLHSGTWKEDVTVVHAMYSGKLSFWNQTSRRFWSSAQVNTKRIIH